MSPPEAEELVDALRRGGVEAVDLARRPYRYATSAPLEDLWVRTEDGGELRLIFKDLSRDRLIGQAQESKPEFLHEPRRELECYRRILSPAGIGPRCVSVVADPAAPRYWLFIEKVPGVELWQIGELPVWEEVAGWLGRFHATFAARVDEVRELNPYLLDHSPSWFRGWCERARSALAGSDDPRAAALDHALAGYDEAIPALVALPRALVHGGLYPPNVLVGDRRPPVRVYPVDWEMAATGPGLIDLAALVGGWEAEECQRLFAAYEDAYAEARAGETADQPPDGLARCRLHLALQWLGWSPEWRPPPEHAHDWLGEALELVEEVGL